MHFAAHLLPALFSLSSCPSSLLDLSHPVRCMFISCPTWLLMGRYIHQWMGGQIQTGTGEQGPWLQPASASCLIPLSSLGCSCTGLIPWTHQVHDRWLGLWLVLWEAWCSGCCRTVLSNRLSYPPPWHSDCVNCFLRSPCHNLSTTFNDCLLRRMSAPWGQGPCSLLNPQNQHKVGSQHPCDEGIKERCATGQSMNTEIPTVYFKVT